MKKDEDDRNLDTEMQSSVYAYWHLMKLCYPYFKDKPGAGASIFVKAVHPDIDTLSFTSAPAWSVQPPCHMPLHIPAEIRYRACVSFPRGQNMTTPNPAYCNP